MANPADLAKLVPGFDFLQGLVKNASAGLPNMGQWIAPTLNPEELSKRIEELRTVQFWLEQNAKLLGTTIQALEVQRMSLATLQQMKVPVAQWAQAFKIKEPAPAPSSAAGRPNIAAAASKRRSGTRKPKASATPMVAPAAAAHPMADPMQWWGALTQQFSELASKAVKESATQAAKTVTAAVVKQGLDAAGAVVKKATSAKGKKT